MGIIGFLILGGIAGWIAERVMKRNHGLLKNVVVGVVGSIVGGFLSSLVGIQAYGFVGNLVVATGGAIVFLWGYDQITNSRR